MIYLANTTTLRYREENCTGCGLCEDVCPRNVFEIRNRKAVLTDPDRCMECGACALNCEFDALSVDAGTGCASALIGSIFNGGEVCCGTDGCC